MDKSWKTGLPAPTKHTNLITMVTHLLFILIVRLMTHDRSSIPRVMISCVIHPYLLLIIACAKTKENSQEPTFVFRYFSGALKHSLGPSGNHFLHPRSMPSHVDDQLTIISLPWSLVFFTSSKFDWQTKTPLVMCWLSSCATVTFLFCSPWGVRISLKNQSDVLSTLFNRCWNWYNLLQVSVIPWK